MRGRLAAAVVLLLAAGACAQEPEVEVLAFGAAGAQVYEGELPPVLRGGSVCPPFGSTSPATSPDPLKLSSLLGSTISVSPQSCLELIVIELEGSGEFPGFTVEYLSRPVLDSPAGEEVSIAGEAVLGIRLGVWMGNPDGEGYTGPREIVPASTTAVREVEQIENFEGMTQWAVGLDTVRSFRVSVGSDPYRLIVEIDGAAIPGSL